MEMKKAELKMGMLMGASMSVCLSLAGMLSAGQFSLVPFIKNVLISFLISQVISNAVPLRRLTMAAVRKNGSKPGSLPARLLETLVSDLILTPLMTLVMVYLAYRQATAQGAVIPFLPMLVKSELISLVVAYVLIFFLTPVYEKLAFGKLPPKAD